MADTQAARELELFIDNDQQSYRHLQEAHKNLIRKLLKGTYDREKAVKLFMYPVETGAKRYAKEFGGPRFDKPTRTLVARSLRDRFETEYRTGDQDYHIQDLMPAAYKRAGWSPKRVREYAGQKGLPKKPPKTMTEAFESKRKQVRKRQRKGRKGSANITTSNPAKINVRQQGSRWRWTLFRGGKIADSGSAASKDQAVRDAKAAAHSKMGPKRRVKKAARKVRRGAKKVAQKTKPKVRKATKRAKRKVRSAAADLNAAIRRAK